VHGLRPGDEIFGFARGAFAEYAIADAALHRFPQAPLRAALESLAQEIDASPRLVIRASGLDEVVRDQIEQACADSGFTGVVAFRDEPGMAVAAFQLEWADGRADHDPEGSAARVAEALSAARASIGERAADFILRDANVAQRREPPEGTTA
jgi:flagellar assembly protein FliH